MKHFLSILTKVFLSIRTDKESFCYCHFTVLLLLIASKIFIVSVCYFFFVVVCDFKFSSRHEGKELQAQILITVGLICVSSIFRRDEGAAYCIRFSRF